MNVQHFEKGVTYTDKELLILARKMGKLATLCKRLKDEASVIRVEAVRRKGTKKKKDEVKVMTTVSLPNKVLRAESRNKTAIEGIDRCVTKLEPQVAKYKDLHILGRRN
jgi:ribosome-associated translation inhibitor RaiA